MRAGNDFPRELKLLCRQQPNRLAPASNFISDFGLWIADYKSQFSIRNPKFAIRNCQCPRQESDLVLDLRGVACESGTPRGRIGRGLRVKSRRPEILSSIDDLTLNSRHSSIKYLAEESNLVWQFRRLPCSSVTLARQRGEARRSRREKNKLAHRHSRLASISPTSHSSKLH